MASSNLTCHCLIFNYFLIHHALALLVTLFTWHLLSLSFTPLLSLPPPSSLSVHPHCPSIFIPPFPSPPPPRSFLSLFCLHSHCIHQILDSVHHIHQHDIVHRDLKVSIFRGASASLLPFLPPSLSSFLTCSSVSSCRVMCLCLQLLV